MRCIASLAYYARARSYMGTRKGGRVFTPPPIELSVTSERVVLPPPRAPRTLSR